MKLVYGICEKNPLLHSIANMGKTQAEIQQVQLI